MTHRQTLHHNIYISTFISIMVLIIIIATKAMTCANDWNQLLTIVALADSWLPYPIMPKSYHTRCSVPSHPMPGILSRPFCTMFYHTRSSIPSLTIPGLLSRPYCTKPYHTSSFIPSFSIPGLLIRPYRTQGCIFCLTCSYPELTKNHVLTSA